MVQLSVFLRQQQTRAGSVCFGDNPNSLAVAERVTAQNSESILQAQLVFLAVVLIQFAPISVSMPGEHPPTDSPKRSTNALRVWVLKLSMIRWMVSAVG
jgi:hypothetical protein